MPSPSINNGFEDLETPLAKVSQLRSLPTTQSVGFTALLLVKKVSEKTAKTGNPFLAVELGDKTGSFNVVIFDNAPQFPFFKAEGAEGSIILFTGATAYYQERFSPKLIDLRKLAPDEYHAYPVQDLVACSEENPTELWTELQGVIAGITHEKLRATATQAITIVEEKLKTWPAGISMHHAYRYGLLEHTVHVLRAAKALLPLYPIVDADLAITGLILHDLGKVEEYDYEMTTKFSRAGILQGHVVIGYRIARQAGLKSGLDADRQERLEHIILSHQGKKEWGAAVMAATPEALFVAHVDNLDAKMASMEAAIKNANEGSDFSERIPSLETAVLVAPVGSAE